jgi:parallel beta-helix repeat protein
LAALIFILGAPWAKSEPTIVTADGISAVSVHLDAGRGGLLLPIPEAVLNTGEGTAAIRVKVASFPGNDTILDFGGGDAAHVAIWETCFNGLSQQGHFRLIVPEAGKKKIVDSPVGDSGRSYTLAFTWREGQWTFWADGKSIGVTQSKNLWKSIPERLALVEPIGVQWQRVEVWSQVLADGKIQDLTAKDRWTLDEKTTFLANRDDNATAQTGLVGPGLMAPDKVMETLQKPVSKRELFVDVAKGTDDGDGSSAKPFKTIVQAAKTAGPGDTVTVMPGTYRESVTLTHSGRRDAPIVFRASTDGQVILSGTDPVGGFEAGGDIAGASLWVKAGFQSRDVIFGDPTYRQRLIAQGPNGIRQMERRGRVDTLWSDGQLLPKAESHDELRPDSFWVDQEKKELVLALAPGDRPEDHRLEIGARGAFFSGDVSHIVLRGFRAIGADTSNFIGAVDMGRSSSNWTIRNIDESGANWAGIIVRGFDHTLLDNVTDDNGDEGISGSLVQYAVMDGNTCRFNNWQRGINPDFEAAGTKFTQVDHMIVRNQTAAFNLGPGIWFDLNNSNVTIENCRLHHNREGIAAEISGGPFILRNNVCFDNEDAGISVGESTNILIANNTLVGNKDGIDLRNIPNRTGPGVASPDGKWKVANVEIKRNIIAQNTRAGIINSFVPIDVAQDKITSDYNLYFRNGTLIQWPLKADAGADVKLDASNDWAVADTGGGTKLLSFDAIHKSLGLEEHSVNADPKFRMPAEHEYETDISGPAAPLQAGASFSPGTEEKTKAAMP